MQQKSDKLLVIKPYFVAWPLGFAYVLACLEANNIPFDFIDANRSKNCIKELELMLNNNHYLAVATGGLTGFYRFFRQVADMVRRYHSDVPFILGGNITKDSGESFLFDSIGINFGVIGEAETSLPELINAIKNGDDDFSKIPGIIYKSATGDVIKNSQKRVDLKKNNILPAWHNFDVDYYIKESSYPFVGDDLKFMPVITGRGCVGKCSFCSPSIGGFRRRPIDHVINEIEEIISKYNFKNIMFYNEMFYPTAKEIRNFCDKYKSLSNRKTWLIQVRVDANIDVDTFCQMKEAGCIAVGTGVESGSDKVLKLMNKKVTSQQIKSFFNNARMAKMPTNGTFIVGCEGETEEDLKRTIDLVIDEEINTGESLMYVYPGTVVYNNAVKRGLIRDEKDHLEKVTKIGTDLYAPHVKEYFVNISDIPDNQFFEIATREVRRYNTFVFNRYPVQNLSCKMETKGSETTVIMEGKCHECKSNVSYKYDIFRGSDYIGLLGWGIHDRLICPKCLKRLSFDVYACHEMKAQREHLFFFKERMSRKNKIIIGGINQDAMFLLRINLLNLEYKKILGFIDFTGQYRGKYYVNYPMLNVDHIVDLNPDCILLVDCVSDAWESLKKAYKKKNAPPPDIYYLCDEKLRDTMKKVRRKAIYRNWYSKLSVSSLRHRLKNRYLSLREI